VTEIGAQKAKYMQRVEGMQIACKKKMLTVGAKWQSHGYTGTEKIPRHPMEPVCKISSNILCVLTHRIHMQMEYSGTDRHEGT
jgi:hypothetical protein